MKQHAPPSSSPKRREVWFWLHAAILFLLAFCLLPVFVWIFRGLSGSSVLGGSPAEGIAFPEAFHISNGEKHLSVASAPELDPAADEDFLLTGWFKIAFLPEEGERMLLQQKYDRAASGVPGYALGLEQHALEILPIA